MAAAAKAKLALQSSSGLPDLGCYGLFYFFAWRYATNVIYGSWRSAVTNGQSFMLKDVLPFGFSTSLFRCRSISWPPFCDFGQPNENAASFCFWPLSRPFLL